MKVELDLPDIKFSYGDLVELPNERNDKSIFLRVISGQIYGNWNYIMKPSGVAIGVTIDLSSGFPTDGEHVGMYSTRVESGSFYDCDPPKPWSGSDSLPIVQQMLESRGLLVDSSVVAM